MLWSTDDLTRWLLQDPDRHWRPGASQALRITRTDLATPGVSIPNLAPVFVAGLIASLCLLAVGIIFAVNAPSFPRAALGLFLPYFAVYYLTPGRLALNVLPVKESIIGLFAVLCLGAILAFGRMAPDLAVILASGVVITYAVLALYAFFQAATDSEFRSRAETVHAIRKSFDKEKANDMLAQAHDTQVFLGGFRAALRDAPNRENAIELTLQKIRTMTAEGAAEARNQLDALATRFEKS